MFKYILKECKMHIPMNRCMHACTNILRQYVTSTLIKCLVNINTNFKEIHKCYK